MPTVLSAIRDLHGKFARARMDTPRLDVELLVGHALDLSRSQLLARLQDQISPTALAEISEYAERRIAGEPVAYIIGRREFFGLKFSVGPAVLTPRPETELLVEWAIAWLKDRPGARVVDVGTGSGAIAVAVASAMPLEHPIVAVEVSPDALSLARQNAERHVPGRVEFRLGNLLDETLGEFDLVLANLPYLRADQIDGNRDVIAEPRVALDGGASGLELIQRLISQLPGALAPGGAAGLEIDPSQSPRVADLLADALPGAAITIHQDLAGLDRFVTAVRI